MKPGTIAQIAFIVLAAVAVFCFIRAARNDQRHTSCSALCALGPVYAGRDRMAPDFELPDMTGTPVKLSSFRGKTVFLNFWTKTCGPCLEEMPALAELAKVARSEENMVVVTVSTDEGPDDVRDLLKVVLNSDIPFPVLFDPESKIVLDRYGTRLFPETWIIDPEGVIRFASVNDLSVGRNPQEVQRVLDALQTDELCPCNWQKGEETLKAA